VRKAIADLPVTIVENPDYTESQMTSVRAGVLAAPEARGYLIIPGDMPLLTAADFDRLITRFEELEAQTRRSCRSTTTERGNPIVIPAGAGKRCTDAGINFGCRNLLINFPELGLRLSEPPNRNSSRMPTQPEAYRDLVSLFEQRQPDRATRLIPSILFTRPLHLQPFGCELVLCCCG
jgi:hypothetical protein